MTTHTSLLYPTRPTSPGRLARRSAGVLALLTLGWSGLADAYPVAFPSRGALPDGVYFESKGHGTGYGTTGWAIDFHARSFNNSQWQMYKDGKAEANATNEDAYIFNAPVFAPEDGEIIGCWRSAPDKASPSNDYDFDGDGIENEPIDDVSPIRGGNHLQIRNAAGDHIVYLAHLKANTIPEELCPLPAGSDANNDGWPESRGKNNCASLGAPWTGYITSTLLPTPVKVKAGDYLGRAGHSGSSNRPHLHMHVKPFALDAFGLPCEGAAEEIEFVETWAQTCAAGQDVTASGWDALAAENPLQTGSTASYCFLPDPIGVEQDHNFYETATTNIHPTTHSSGDLLVYQTAGALRLRSYKLQASGIIVDQDMVSEGAVSDVAVARPGSARDVVVSVRGSNGNLKHIPYAVSATNGAIARQNGKELSESAVFQVESTPSPAHPGYVVAIEDGAGNLKVIDYHVDAALNISRDYTSTGTGGAIDDVAITTVTDGFDGVVTAELTPGGQLVLRSFEVPASGGVTWADTYATLVGADSVTVDTVPMQLGGAYIVTSVQLSNTSHALRLDTWELDPNGQILWVDTISAGGVTAHDATPTIAGGDLVSAMRDEAGNFRMIGWRIDPFGGITRNATRSMDGVTSTSIIASLGSDQDHLVAARTDALGKLHLFTYGSAFMSEF